MSGNFTTSYAGCHINHNADRQAITCWLPIQDPDDAQQANTRSQATVALHVQCQTIMDMPPAGACQLLL
jgi:hypothetical protein